MKARALIQKLLPSDCLQPEIIEYKSELLVKIKSRLEYNVLHELTKDFVGKASAQGFSRQQQVYLLPLTNLSRLQDFLSENLSTHQETAEALLVAALEREFNALLQRTHAELSPAAHEELAKAVAAAKTTQQWIHLSRIDSQISHYLKEINTHTTLLTNALHDKPLVSDDALKPLNDHLDALKPSLTCCWLFTNYLKKNEYDVLSNLVTRLKKPFVEQTIKELTATARQQLGMIEAIYPSKAAQLLNDLDQMPPAPAEAKQATPTPAPVSETQPLLPVTTNRPPQYQSSLHRFRAHF